MADEPRYTVAEVLAMLCSSCRRELSEPGYKTCWNCRQKAERYRKTVPKAMRGSESAVLVTTRKNEEAYLAAMMADLEEGVSDE